LVLDQQYEINMKLNYLCFTLTCLVSLVVSLAALPAQAQGTFTYNFVLDDSPWKVYALFQADSTAVASGQLTMLNTFGGYMTQGGRQAPLDRLDMPVDPVTGTLTGDSGNTWVGAYFDRDWWDIWGGNIAYYQHRSVITYWPWVGSPAESLSGGWWNVRFTPTPEPNSLSLLGLGLLALALKRKRLRP
jgi:hypothetical protein